MAVPAPSSDPANVLSLPTWFHGVLSRKEAEALLERYGKFDGLFLVRESVRENGYVLSLCYNGQMTHYQICYEEQNDESFLRLDTENSSGPKFSCLDGVFHYLLNAPSVLPCPLTQWVSRTDVQPESTTAKQTQQSPDGQGEGSEADGAKLFLKVGGRFFLNISSSYD